MFIFFTWGAGHTYFYYLCNANIADSLNQRLAVSGDSTTFAIRPLMLCRAESGGTALPLGK